MEWINKQNVLIVGLGLMGGSYAKALKRIGCHVSAIDKSEETIKFALENDVIDEGTFKEEETKEQEITDNSMLDRIENRKMDKEKFGLEL